MDVKDELADPAFAERLRLRDPMALRMVAEAYLAQIVRAARGSFEHPPDQVAFPRDEGEVVAVLDWCDAAKVAVVPYGGGSSVAGGSTSQEPRSSWPPPST